MPQQATLFDLPSAPLPDGLRYRPALISREDEAALVAAFATLAFKEFEFHGFLGKRRVVSFGWRYAFDGSGLQKTTNIPDFLLPARAKAAAFAAIDAHDLQHALVTEYPPGSTIGWHKDRPVFGDVIGLSLLSPCLFRLRRKSESRRERASFTAEPRSGYHLRGEARDNWEHIPAVEAVRYSITFRTLRAGAAERDAATIPRARS